MSYPTPNTRIDHDSRPPKLSSMFYALESWLCSKGLRAGPPPSTKPGAKVNTTSFVCLTNGKERVLCSLQYLPQGGWLQFHWYKDVLEESGRLEAFKHARATILPLTAKSKMKDSSDVKDFTSKEYRINLTHGDEPQIAVIIGLLEPIFPSDK